MKHQHIKKKTETERSKLMYRYAQLNRFRCECQRHINIYTFIHIDPQTMPVEYHFPSTKTFVVKYKKISTPGTVPKQWLGFS